MREYILSRIREYADKLEECIVNGEHKNREFLIYCLTYYAAKLDQI